MPNDVLITITTLWAHRVHKYMGSSEVEKLLAYPISYGLLTDK
jgi:hypothetical protein